MHIIFYVFRISGSTLQFWINEADASFILFWKGLKIQNFKLVISNKLINIYE